MRLHTERDGDGPPLVLLHGFGQTARCWGTLPASLTADYEVIRLDAPGHGDTGGEGVDLRATADIIAETVGPAAYVGYSMGGRMALQLAVDRPDVVQRLVVIGGTPGIADDSERAARREADQALAQRIRDEGVDAFIRYWLDLPLFAGLPADARFEEERRRNTAEGLATELASWPSWFDVSPYDGRQVPFFKRAQIAAADLALAGLAPGGDLHRLTLFADNLVPHVLRIDGVLEFDGALVARIDAGELIEHDAPEEVEIRACALHAVELLVAAHPEPTTATAVDNHLWHRGAAPRYKAHPRHRTRTTAY